MRRRAKSMKETRAVRRLSLICAAGPIGLPAGTFPIDEPADLAGFAPEPAPMAHLLTAPERRARQTAAVLGPGAIVEPALQDCDYGTWRGRSLGEIGATDPVGAAAWIADPAAAPHGGESLLA